MMRNSPEKNIANILDKLERLENEQILAVLVPNNFLTVSSYLEFRKNILDKLLAIVGFTNNFFIHTGTRMNVLFISKNIKTENVAFIKIDRTFENQLDENILSKIELICGDNLLICNEEFSEKHLSEEKKKYSVLKIENIFSQDILNKIVNQNFEKKVDNLKSKGNVKEEEYNFDIDFWTDYTSIMSKYHKLFKDEEPKKLLEIVDVDLTQVVNKGDLIIHHRLFNEFKIEIVKEEKEYKTKETLLLKIKDEYKSKISSMYLIHYFSQEQISSYINLYSIGGAIKHLNIKKLKSLKIIIPKTIKDFQETEANLNIKSKYAEIIEYLYINEFLPNRKDERWFSAITIAGTILEGLLQQIILVDLEKSEKTIQQKTLGQLVEILELCNYFDKNQFDMIKDVVKHRNFVHIGKIKNEQKDIAKLKRDIEESLKKFDQLINSLGI